MYKSHSVVEVFLHFVFVTKYRRKVSILAKSNLEFIRKEFDSIAIEVGCEISDLNVGNDNHVHLLLATDGNCTISNIANRIKANTSKIFANELRHRQGNCITEYWPGWQTGYYCASIGEVNGNQIKNYINNQ